ncbi:unnamed protein product [Rotaria sp. Silwood1]|nr:unnamed protein product [Rotaria sp. Silwood1]CAF4689708.1 unnamed protein product [Rotaria sp. Silwood1]
MFGNLFLEMGEYATAEAYFDTILNSLNPTDEEIACIFFNFGRTHQLKVLDQKCLASAGKTLNGLGIYSKKHVDVAGTLINLGTIDCDRQHYDEAIVKYRKAKQIYDSSLPSCHPNHAIIRVNLGNVYLASRDYSKACEEYEIALKLQQQLLSSDHPDIARTLEIMYKECPKRAEEIAGHTLSSKHPVVSLIRKTKALMAEES